MNFTRLPIFLVCITAGCSGTSTGNGLGTSTGNGLTSVSMTMQNSQSLTETESITVLDEADAAFTFTAAKVGVRDIDFHLQEGLSCADVALELEEPVVCDEDKIRIEGPFVVDLFSGEATPSLAGLTIPTGAYRRVDVRFDDARSDWGLLESDDPLLNNSFLLEGQIESTGDSFRITIDVNVEARYLNEQAQLLSQEAAESVFLNLDPSSWFSALPISQCILDGEFDQLDDLILIQDSGSNCQEIENALKQVIRDSGSLNISP